MGTDKENETLKKLLAETEADVCKIEDSIAFLQSDVATQFLGKDTAKQMKEQMIKAKAEGETICTCPACQAGKAILKYKTELL